MHDAVRAFTVEPVCPVSMATRTAVVGSFVGMPTTGIQDPVRWQALETDQQLFSLGQQVHGAFHGEPVEAYAAFKKLDGFHEHHT